MIRFRAFCALLLLGLAGKGFALAESLYSYVDEQGVLHISNLPTDPRYQLLPPGNLAQKFGHRWSPHSHFRQEIETASSLYDIPIALVKAVIKVESDFNPYAISSKGAMGLMQLMPDTAIAMNVNDVYNPRENIIGGTRYLRHLMNRFEEDLVLTLAAYHSGETRVAVYGAIPPIPQTREYVDQVLYYYQYYRRED